MLWTLCRLNEYDNPILPYNWFGKENIHWYYPELQFFQNKRSCLKLNFQFYNLSRSNPSNTESVARRSIVWIGNFPFGVGPPGFFFFFFFFFFFLHTYWKSLLSINPSSWHLKIIFEEWAFGSSLRIWLEVYSGKSRKTQVKTKHGWIWH